MGMEQEPSMYTIQQISSQKWIKYYMSNSTVGKDTFKKLQVLNELKFYMSKALASLSSSSSQVLLIVAFNSMWNWTSSYSSTESWKIDHLF